jgi:hypothetical protein
MNNEEKQILDKLLSERNEYQIAAAFEFLRKSTDDLSTIYDLLDNKQDLLNFDKQQLDFIKKLLQIMALTTSLNASYFFKKCLKSPDTQVEFHQLAWEGITKTMIFFMKEFDAEKTFEENLKENWK